ncbi:Transcription elongation factor GreA [bioreactor metagenome]|uniref:Transcription elongation factor GreA n=1 Tax=bioreactor metagenome TaxID=1076179 RepID=A0A644YRP0_9ZZZZ
MLEQPVYLTNEGLKKAEERLEYLKAVRRSEVAERIKQAKEFGDLSENSEYDDAKNEQAFIEGEIQNLERMLRNAVVIKENDTASNIVSVGSKVSVRDESNKEEFSYTIVGTAEADPFADKISNESPLGKSLLGKKNGEIVEVNLPIGTARYKILKISR